MKYLKFSLLTVVIIILLIILPVFFHTYYYKLRYPEDCKSYVNKTAQEIFEQFKNKKGYTKMEASYFLRDCKIKNAAIHIYYYPTYDKYDENPFRIIPIPTAIYGIELLSANAMLNSLFDTSFELTYDTKEDRDKYYHYWRVKIKEKFDIDVEPIKYRYETK